jgi:hypothetical protein
LTDMPAPARDLRVVMSSESPARISTSWRPR